MNTKSNNMKKKKKNLKQNTEKSKQNSNHLQVLINISKILYSMSLFPNGWTSTTLCINISMGKLIMGL